jgi:hypothetical protein
MQQSINDRRAAQPATGCTHMTLTILASLTKCRVATRCLPLSHCCQRCRYFTGVTAVLQSLGIINNNTRLAGSSGGAITAAAICSNVPAATQQLAANFNIAAACRPSLACRGYLDSVVRHYTDVLFLESVMEQCKRRLYVTVTEARPNNLTDPPQARQCDLYCIDGQQLPMQAVGSMSQTSSAWPPQWVRRGCRCRKVWLTRIDYYY